MKYTSMQYHFQGDEDNMSSSKHCYTDSAGNRHTTSVVLDDNRDMIVLIGRNIEPGKGLHHYLTN